MQTSLDRENPSARQETDMGMIRRRTRRRTALVVGGAAYAAGRASGGRQQGDDEQYEEEAPPAPPPPAATSGGDDVDELQRLADLHTSGALTDEEFAAAKAKILGT
jgi:hypothetical protein